MSDKLPWMRPTIREIDPEETPGKADSSEEFGTVTPEQHGKNYRTLNRCVIHKEEKADGDPNL